MRAQCRSFVLLWEPCKQSQYYRTREGIDIGHRPVAAGIRSSDQDLIVSGTSSHKQLVQKKISVLFWMATFIQHKSSDYIVFSAKNLKKLK